MSLAIRRFAPAVTRAVTTAAPVRLAHTLNERERAAEAAYFNREEEKLLRKLLGKVRAQVDSVEEKAPAAPVAAEGAISAERRRLVAIVGKYKMSEEDIRALIAWRHAHEY